MKTKIQKILLSWFACVAFTALMAQVPQSFSYQAVARNAAGQPISKQNVSFRISLLQGTISGTSVFTETHIATTNDFGLVTLAIGNGTVVSGTFNSINWAVGPYFVKIEMDTAAGTNYLLMGTSQLMSVPYAKYAELSGNAALPHYTQAQIDALTPAADMLVFNTDYKMMQFYDGTQWSGSQSSGCVPKPISCVAGTDQLGLKTTTATLAGNAPGPGITGKWEIVSGAGGSFADASKYNTTFTGVNNSCYTLKWNQMTVCDTLSANIVVTMGAPIINFSGTLYVYPVDNSAGIQWYNGTYTTTGATSTTDGETNTTTIVSNQSAGAYAAYLCDTLNALGFSDWYLPAKDELNAIYMNKSILGGFTTEYYWSSIEDGSVGAGFQDFSNGFQSYYGKNGSLRVRCVRR